MQHAVGEPTPSRLNPFSFPTETDGRFLLLVLVIAGVTFNLTQTVLYTYTNIASDLIAGLISVGVVVALFAWTWQRARGAAGQEVKRNGWQLLDLSAFTPAEQEAFGRFNDNLRQTVGRLPEVAAHPPEFVWDGNDRAAGGRAFGYGQRQYVLLRRGLYEAFWIKFEAFQAILLHELSHLANRDVSKTTFSVQLGKTFYVIGTLLAILMNFSLLYYTVRRLILDMSLIPVWDGFKLFLEMNAKLLLLFLLIEIIRSSVLRVREYYADSRTAIWLGKSRSLLQLILNSQTTLEQQKHGLASIQAQLRAKLAPFHPEARQRAEVLKDERLLFEPGHGITFLAGIATGIALDSNFVLVGIALNSISQLINSLNTAASASNDLSFVTFIFYLVTILIIVTVGFMLVILILVALLPTVATVGIDIQKAAFADQFQPAGQQLLPSMRLVSLAFIFGLGTVSGSFLSPALGPLTPGSLAIGTRALLLLPLFILGWTIVFLLWFIPLRKLARQLYVAHRAAERPIKKRRWLTVISAAALLPMLGQMSLTQTLLSAYVGFPADFATSDFQELAQLLIGGGWMAATLFTIVIWLVGWAWLKIRGWLQHTADGRVVPLWAAVPHPYRLPGPPLAPVMDGPPPL